MTAAIVILTATAARADDSLTPPNTDPEEVFKCNELSLDAFGAYQTVVNTPFGGTLSNRSTRDFWGGGLGLNYYFDKYLGIGGESAAFDNTKHFIDYVGGNVFARYPIQCARLAPYIFGGGGRAFQPQLELVHRWGRRAGLSYMREVGYLWRRALCLEGSWQRLANWFQRPHSPSRGTYWRPLHLLLIGRWKMFFRTKKAGLIKSPPFHHGSRTLVNPA